MSWNEEIGEWQLVCFISPYSYCHLILWSSCIPKFWVVEIIVACCFIFKKFVAYTGNHMRKVTPTPDPKDKNKEVNVARKNYCNLFRIKIMMECCCRKWLAFQRWGRFLVRSFCFTKAKMTIIKKRCLALSNLGRGILVKYCRSMDPIVKVLDHWLANKSFSKTLSLYIINS